MVVYIINKREGLDYSSAEDHGPVVTWFNETSAFNLDVFKRKAEDLADEWLPKNAILLSPGIPSAIFCIYFIAALRTRTLAPILLNVLIFSSNNDCYEKRVLNLS